MRTGLECSNGHRWEGFATEELVWKESKYCPKCGALYVRMIPVGEDAAVLRVTPPVIPFWKKIPLKVWMIVAGVIAVLMTLEAVTGANKLRSSEEEIAKLKKQNLTASSETIQAKEERDVWMKAAKSSKRIRITSRVATVGGKPVTDSEGKPVYNTTYEELTRSGSSSSGASSSMSIVTSRGQTVISVEEYEALKRKKTEKSNLRFYAGPSLKIEPGIPKDYKRWGIQAGGRLLWRFGASINVSADGAAIVATPLYF